MWDAKAQEADHAQLHHDHRGAPLATGRRRRAPGGHADRRHRPDAARRRPTTGSRPPAPGSSVTAPATPTSPPRSGDTSRTYVCGCCPRWVTSGWPRSTCRCCSDTSTGWPATGLAAETIGVSVVPIRAIYARAEPDSARSSRNPARGLALPAARTPERRIASPGEVERILAVVEPRGAMGDRVLRGAASRRAAGAALTGRGPGCRGDPRPARLGSA